MNYSASFQGHYLDIVNERAYYWPIKACFRDENTMVCIDASQA